MKVLVAVLCVLMGSLGLAQTDHGYFLGNQARAKSGKKLVDDPSVEAVFHSDGRKLSFSKEGLAFMGDRARKTSATLRHVNGAMVSPELGAPSGHRVNILKGSPEHWLTHLSSSKSLTYARVWQGIDLTYEPDRDGLKVRFEIAPGSDPALIGLAAQGFSSKRGPTHDTEISLSRLRAWQPAEEGAQALPVRSAVSGETLSLSVDAHDRNRPLYIEGTLVWGTYLGGGGGGSLGSLVDKTIRFSNVAVDKDENIYIAGGTSSGSMPQGETTLHGYAADADIYVAKFSPDGSRLLWSTYFGGTQFETATGLEVLPDGAIALTGRTNSADFPTTEDAYDRIPNGDNDAFLAILDPQANRIRYATFFGGSSWDEATDLAVADDGGIILYGRTDSDDLPTTAGAHDTVKDETDFFAAKIHPGRGLIFSTFIGGQSHEWEPTTVHFSVNGDLWMAGHTSSQDFPLANDPGRSSTALIFLLRADGSDLMAVHVFSGSYTGIYDMTTGPDGHVYVTGFASPEFQTTPGAFLEEIPRRDSVFVAKVKPDGSELVYATGLVENNLSWGYGLAIDDHGQATVVLQATDNATIPVPDSAFDAEDHDDPEAVVCTLNADGTDVLAATYLGGSNWERPLAVARMDRGDLVVIGISDSHDFPTNRDWGFSEPASDYWWVTRLDSALETSPFSTKIGLYPEPEAHDVIVDDAGAVYVTGEVYAPDFPVSEGAYQPNVAGSSDVVITKLSPDGSQLVFSTYLGGSGSDVPAALSLGPDGALYVTGKSNSNDFPTTSGAVVPADGRTGDGVFVAKLSGGGSHLDYATFLSESRGYANDLAVDGFGQAYIAGYAEDAWPVTDGVLSGPSQNKSPFLTQLSADGGTILTSTSLGFFNSPTVSNGEATAVAVDDTGSVYLAGRADQPSVFPHTSTVGGSGDPGNLFLWKLPPSWQALEYGVMVDAELDTKAFMAFDGNGHLYLAGATRNSDFRTPPCPDLSSDLHGFVSKFVAATGQFLWTACIGGNGEDIPEGIVVTRENRTFLTMKTSSSDLATRDASGWIHNGHDDVVLVEMDRNCQLAYATYLGGRGDTRVAGIALTEDNQLVLAGSVTGAIQVTDDAFQTTASGMNNMWVKKLSPATCSAPRFLQPPLEMGARLSDRGQLYIPSFGSEPMTYQWYKDGIPIEGATEPSLSFGGTPVEPSDIGFYMREDTNLCGTTRSRPFYLQVDAFPGQVSLIADPKVQTLGIHMTGFFQRVDGWLSDFGRWNPPPGLTAQEEEKWLIVQDAPPGRHQIELEKRVGAEWITALEVTLLVPSEDVFRDFNGDGMNNVADWWMLAPFWKGDYAVDPNSDGVIDILDFMYLAIDPSDQAALLDR
ncbi:hypothetical protein SCOR_29785 [Sulfidibacter corallicola]|uniref:DUF7948 domain-containing protein n=1 Tax=Sulfidibacter corallicola TaxID=2818388 RepID=A0A8A4TKZ9_SULCO|nr:hypothetical protein [Sulfidibacter corallicola]QTD50253.1 hypothetical protein J3U87_32105 [Sulfidibacter corallicola]